MRLLFSLSRVLACIPRAGGTVQQRLSLYHTSQALCAGQNWRLSHGQSRSGTEYGILTNTPDWSYVDGRPAPETKSQKRQRKRQSAINGRIRMLLREMDKAKQQSNDPDSESIATSDGIDETDETLKQKQDS